MYDVRSLSTETRTDIQICNTIYDFTRVLHIFLDGDKYHIDKFLYMISEHNETGNKIHYQQNTKQVISYITVNGIKLRKELFHTLIFMEKSIPVINMINKIEAGTDYNYMYNDYRKLTIVNYYDKYFPYDDIKILRDTLGHLIIPK